MLIGSCLHKEIHPTLLLGVQKCVCSFFDVLFFFFFRSPFCSFFFQQNKNVSLTFFLHMLAVVIVVIIQSRLVAMDFGGYMTF